MNPTHARTEPHARPARRDLAGRLVPVVIATIALLALALAGTARAQHDPQALEWLERAYERQGGDAYRALTLEQNARVNGDFSFFGPNGEVFVTMTFESRVDRENDREFMIMWSGDEPFMKSARAGSTHRTWAPHTGTLRQPRSEVEIRDRNQYRSALGLARGVEGRDDVTIERDVTLAGITGTLLRVVTNGVEALYLLDDEGLLLADTMELSDIGVVLNVYTDYTTFKGMPSAETMTTYVNGTAIMRMDIREYEFDVAFTDEEFELP